MNFIRLPRGGRRVGVSRLWSLVRAGLPAAVVVLAGLATGARDSRAVTLPPGFTETTLGNNLPQATGFAFLPDGRALLVRKHGLIHIVPPSGNPGYVGTITNVFTVGEAGLTGVAIDPLWPSRPFVYLFYSMAAPRQNVVERYTASGILTSPTSVALSLGSPYRVLNLPDQMSNHNGGCLRFDGAGKLLVTHGDDVRSCVALNPANQNGVVMRLNISTLPPGSGGPPPRADLVVPTNPFAADTSGASLVLCYGMRNPYRFTVDPLDGQIYVGDVGGLDWEEIDVVAGTGENFGWPVWEADSLTGVDCGSGVIPYVPPIVKYIHDPADTTGPPGFFAVVGGPRYRRSGQPYVLPAAYEGILFYADHGKGWIRLARRVAGVWEPFSVAGQADAVNWALGYHRITDLQEGPDGALYLTTFIGRFVRILPPFMTSGVGLPPNDRPGRRPEASVAPNPLRAGTRLARLDGARGEAVVIDPLGRVIRRLEEPAWDGRLDGGRAAAPGTYWIVTADRRGRVVIVE